VHFLGTCENKTAAQCEVLILPAGETRFFPEVAIAQQYTFRKIFEYQKNIRVSHRGLRSTTPLHNQTLRDH